MRHTTVEQYGRHRATLALSMTAALVLTGCSSSPNTAATTSAFSAPATSEPATTTAPTPSTAAVYKPATDKGPAENVPVPVLPEKAKEFSKEGLIAFAEYWYSTLGYVFETGDSGPMMAISVPECKTCAFINEPVGEHYDSGGWIVGGQMTILQSTSPFVETSEGAYQAMLLVRQAQVTYYKSDGTVKTELPQAIAKTNLVEAVYRSDGWVANTAEILKRG